MAPILTIFGPNRSQRRNLFFEKFSNERRRHRGVVVVVIVAVVVAVVGRFWVACIKGTSLILLVFDGFSEFGHRAWGDDFFLCKEIAHTVRSQSPYSVCRVENVGLWKIKKSFLFFYFGIQIGIGIGIGIEVGMTWGSVKNSGEACVFCTVLIRGTKPPPITTRQNTQASPEFLTLPQVIPTSIPIPIPIQIPN